MDNKHEDQFGQNSPENQPNQHQSAPQPYLNPNYQQAQNGQPNVQPINIQLPQQKSSKAPWIILGIIALLIVLAMGSCVAAPFMLMKSAADSLGSMDLSSYEDIGIVQENSIAVFDMTAAISGNSGTTPTDMYKTLKRLEDNDNIKAVVVRVNCPGGTVAASEEIAQYIKDFKKPILFHVSDMCASGAYWSASQSDHIMAMSTSEVGSIGVIMQTMNIQGLLEKLGIEMGSIKSAESKDAGAMYRSLTDEEKAELQKDILAINDKFIDAVAEGRGMDRAKVAELATGQTYSGDLALEYGMIDSLGTFKDAVNKAAELAGIDPEDAHVYETNLYSDPFGLGSLFAKSSENQELNKLTQLAITKLGGSDFQAKNDAEPVEARN